VKLDIECGKKPFPKYLFSPAPTPADQDNVDEWLFVPLLFFLLWPGQCLVIFFRLNPPCEPTAMVNALCAGTVENRLKSRYVHRLTPVTRIGKANAEGLEAVAKEVLPSYFHQGEECIKVCAFCLFLLP